MTYYTDNIAVPLGAPVQIIVGGSSPDRLVYVYCDKGAIRLGMSNSTVGFPVPARPVYPLITPNTPLPVVPLVFALPGGWDLWADIDPGVAVPSDVLHIIVTRGNAFV